MPVPDIHPLHEIPMVATTASVASAQTATVRAPFSGRIMKIAVAPTTSTTGGTGTLTVTCPGATGTTIGTVSVPLSTLAEVSSSTYGACTEGDLIVFTYSGAATAGGVTYNTAYIRRGG